MMKCSRDQRCIGKYLEDYNVIVNSNPGSGKTTTAIYVAKKFPNSNILLITYSAHLKSETRQKLRFHNIHNIEAHSYHSFFRKYYSEHCSTDYHIEQSLSQNRPFLSFGYEIIIIDECQDMTLLYFNSIKKIINDNHCKNSMRLCILGDELQNIYGFKGADARFLTMGKDIFDTAYKWKCTHLQTSFRLTEEIATFINKVMYNGKRKYPIIACKNRCKPKYYLVDSYTTDIVNIVNSVLERHAPGDIFILAASLRNPNSPVKILENVIKTTRPDIALFIPDADDESLNERIMSHKLVFATFHQSKGRERPVTIVLNFDSSYTLYYNQNPEYQTKCPNELNVACSRSTEELILVHDRKYGPLPFINQNELKYCVEMYNCGEDANKISKEQKDHLGMIQKTKKVKCTDLTRFVSHNFLEMLRKTVLISRHRKAEKPLDFPSTAKFNHYGTEIEESVSNLIGITVPLIFEYKKTRQSRCYRMLKRYGYLDSKKPYLRNHKKFPDALEKFKISHWLALANIWNHYLSKYYYKLYQINNYSFADKGFFKTCLQRLESLNISDHHAEFEDSFSLSDTRELPGVLLSCSLDCVDHFNNSVYEFKCVDQITIDHILQVSIYMYADMHRDSESTCPIKHDCQQKKWFIYNMRTDELLQIRFENPTILQSIVSSLYEDKYGKKSFEKISDKEFLHRCNVMFSS